MTDCTAQYCCVWNWVTGIWSPVARDDNDDEGVKHTGVKVKYSEDGLDKIVLRVTDATGVGLNGDSDILVRHCAAAAMTCSMCPGCKILPSGTVLIVAAAA